MVFHKGDEAEDMYFIKEGQVEIFDDKGIILVTLSTGSFFGEIALFEATRRTASARAKGNTELCILNKEDFNHIMLTYPAVAELIRESVRKRKEQGERVKAEQEAKAKAAKEEEERLKREEEERKRDMQQSWLSLNGKSIKSVFAHSLSRSSKHLRRDSVPMEPKDETDEMEKGLNDDHQSGSVFDEHDTGENMRLSTCSNISSLKSMNRPSK
jgi:CRP-like cAMP-binding protein